MIVIDRTAELQADYERLKGQGTSKDRTINKLGLRLKDQSSLIERYKALESVCEDVVNHGNFDGKNELIEALRGLNGTD